MKRNPQPDCELQLTVLPEAEPGAHMLVRQRFQSRLWWTVMAFESEEKAPPLFDEIIQFHGVKSEIIKWPIIRFSRMLGTKPDRAMILFVDKTTITQTQLLEIILKHGASSPTKASPNLDFFPISYGYIQSLIGVLSNIFKLHKETDN